MRQVEVKGIDTDIKTVHVKDTLGKPRIILWREDCHIYVMPDDLDVVIDVYKNETHLTTTSRSQIKVSSIDFLVLLCDLLRLWKYNLGSIVLGYAVLTSFQFFF